MDIIKPRATGESEIDGEGCFRKAAVRGGYRSGKVDDAAEGKGRGIQPFHSRDQASFGEREPCSSSPESMEIPSDVLTPLRHAN